MKPGRTQWNLSRLDVKTSWFQENPVKPGKPDVVDIPRPQPLATGQSKNKIGSTLKENQSLFKEKKQIEILKSDWMFFYFYNEFSFLSNGGRWRQMRWLETIWNNPISRNGSPNNSIEMKNVMVPFDYRSIYDRSADRSASASPRRRPPPPHPTTTPTPTTPFLIDTPPAGEFRLCACVYRVLPSFTEFYRVSLLLFIFNEVIWVE